MSVVLVSGGTGLVGSELVRLLRAARPERQVIILTRSPSKVKALHLPSGVTALKSDLTHPTLGLSAGAYSELASSLTEIIHGAADIRFGLPLEAARAVNTEGTRNMLALARKCSRLEKFAHLSTVYVAGRASGRLSEAVVNPQDGFCNSYQQSKFEAEELVVSAMPEIPIVIFRLSSMIGHSTSGRVRQFNHVHQLLKLFSRGMLRVAPGDPNAPIDLIADDWAARALAYLYQRRFVAGEIYQLCAGADGSLTLRQMIDLTLEVFARHPAGPSPVHLPQLVGLQAYEEYVTRGKRAGNGVMNEMRRLAGSFLPHLAIFQIFDNQRAARALEGSGLQPPPTRGFYTRVVEYCLDTDWGRRQAQLSSAVAAE